MKRTLHFCFLLVTSIACIAALRKFSQAQPNLQFGLTSAFANGATIPSAYTCVGVNDSPPLNWDGAPAGTQTFALILKDPDAPRGIFIHWVLYNLSANTRELPPNAARSLTATQAQQGHNGFGYPGYGGPCPPPGKVHHYHFVLYALDSKLDLASGATADEVENSLRGHVLASIDLVGTFEH